MHICDNYIYYFIKLLNMYVCRFDMDPRWSETGDRYIIKLFRDYVFHQVDENGVPVVDMAHVLTCLNKVIFFSLLFYLTLFIQRKKEVLIYLFIRFCVFLVGRWYR